MKFTKPALSIPDQITLLESRGMAIPDKVKAEHYLLHISYYRLRAYWLTLEQGTPDHKFKAGVSLDDAIELYVFDRQLRLHIMDAIERVEISLRGAWAYHLATTRGPHGYVDPTIYDRADYFANGLTALVNEVAISKDTFIEHYRTKYGDPPQPPIWMTAEILTLGALSKWLHNLKLRSDRNAIARPYGIDERILVSAAHHLANIRNICAHHGRLWNRSFTVTMRTPNSPANLANSMNPAAPRKLYNSVVFLAYMMEIVAPGTRWKAELIKHVKSCALAPPSAMGFPNGWENFPMWR